MYFITLVKFKKKMDREFSERNRKRLESEEKQGIRFHGIYWTLGKYDSVAIFEAPDEKTAIRMAIDRSDDMDMKTMVAIPLEEGRKLIGLPGKS